MLFKFSMPPQLQWADRNSMAFSVESGHPFRLQISRIFLSLPNEYKLEEALIK